MTRKWTFLVYMAGDNGRIFDDGGRLFADLQSYGWEDLRKMSRVGSTDEVAIVAQYDCLDKQDATPRFYIDGQEEFGKVIEKIPPINTGDPTSLTDFMVWGMKSYPAERYALILWNHGTGWKEEDIYARYREVEEAVNKHELKTRAAPTKAERLRHSFFLSTLAQIMSLEDDEERGICYDDSSMDFLNNRDLVMALHNAQKQTGQRLSLLGMDACLMSMLEVAVQVRQHADIMVGSQEVELAYGWPYTEILRTLVDNPTMPTRDLGKLIVSEYETYYMQFLRNGGGFTTQSAIDLSKMRHVKQRVITLTNSLRSHHDHDLYTEIAVARARRDVQRFRDKDYIDLYDFTRLLKTEYGGTQNTRDVAKQLIDTLHPSSPTTPIVANYRGATRPNANGLSIYFPWDGCSQYYGDIDFADTGWKDWLHQVNRVGR